MRARLLIVVALLGLPEPSAAQGLTQEIIQYGVWFAANRFGALVARTYDGSLEMSQTSGPDSYSASATLSNGVVHCSATSRSPEGTFSTAGPGLIEISLGLADTAPPSPPQPGKKEVIRKMYEIRVACPHPRSSRKEADWANEWSTYKHYGGEFDATFDANGMIVHQLPGQFKGRWSDTSDEESRTMTWNLCVRYRPCQ